MIRSALILFALSTTAFANEQLIQQLSLINQEAQDCSSMSDDELSLQCAHEVCGSPEKISLEVSPKDAERYLSPDNRNKLKSLDNKLRNYFTRILNDNKQFIEELEKRVQSPSFNDISQWKDEDYRNFLPYFVSDIDLDIDYQSPVDKRVSKLNTPKTHPYFKVQEEIINNLTLEDHPFLALNLGIIGSYELKPVLSKRLTKIKDTLKKQNKTLNINFDELQFALQSGTKKDSEITGLFMQLETELLRQNIKTGKELCQEECKKTIPKVLKNFNIKEFRKEFDENNVLNVEDYIAFCKASFTNANIENTRREEFRRIWPEVKQSFDENVFSRFSEHSRNHLRSYLEHELNFIYSGIQTKEFPDLESSLNYQPIAWKKESTSALISKAITPSAFSSDEPFIECPLVESQPILWDAFLSREALLRNPSLRPVGVDVKKDNIMVSPYACEHQGVGKGIMAHEVAHAITHAMARGGVSKTSLKEYGNLRVCATNQWKSNPKTAELYFKKDKLYTEEDTADLISYMAIKDPQHLFGCSVLYPTPTGYKLLSTKPAADDPHTPGIIRLIREIQYKAPERMPPTCKEIMKRNHDKFGKKCF